MWSSRCVVSWHHVYTGEVILEIVGLDSPTTILQSYTQTILPTWLQQKSFMIYLKTGQTLYFSNGWRIHHDALTWYLIHSYNSILLLSTLKTYFKLRWLFVLIHEWLINVYLCSRRISLYFIRATRWQNLLRVSGEWRGDIQLPVLSYTLTLMSVNV